MTYGQTLKHFLISAVLVIALLINPKTVYSGVWVCTYSPIGPNNKKYMSYSTQGIALMYLGYTNYYNGKIVKVHIRDEYDYLTASMFLNVGLNSNIYNYNKYLSNKIIPASRLTPSVVKNDIDMVITMRANSPSIGYVSELLPVYDVAECLDR